MFLKFAQMVRPSSKLLKWHVIKYNVKVFRKKKYVDYFEGTRKSVLFSQVCIHIVKNF